MRWSVKAKRSGRRAKTTRFVLVNEFRESLAPISGDIEVFEEGELLR